MQSKDLIRVKAYYLGCTYPKAPAVLGEGANNWGITLWEVIDVEEGLPKLNKRMRSDVLVIKGSFYSPLKSLTPYSIVANNPETTQYGTDYKLVYINEFIDCKSASGAKAFLKTILTKGQLTELYKVYPDPLPLIAAHDVEALKKVKGIKNYIANCIIERYEESKDMSSIYIELDEYGLTQGLISKMMNKYKSPEAVIKIVKENPYKLVYDVDGIGFITADRIAINGGLSPYSPKRIASYVYYFLKDEAYNKGNSYIRAGILQNQIYYYFGGKEEIYREIEDENGNTVSNIGLAFKSLQDDQIITIEDSENKSLRRVYLNSVHSLESEIAYHLRRLMNADNKFEYKNWEKHIKKCEKDQGFNFDEDQLNGIKLGLDNQVCLITGGAGTGKSSLVSGIISSLPGYTFAQCALSGKAAARLQEVTHSDGMTIHRLLEFDGLTGGFARNWENPLNYDIIILDEISLVGGEIFLDLLRAIPSGSKLLMLGDNGQLPSIGLLNLATDITESSKIPTVILKNIHRQSAESGIIVDANKVRNQEEIFDQNYVGYTIHGHKQDMIFDIIDNSEDTLERTITQFNTYFDGELANGDINKIQILTPIKERGKCSVMALNHAIQAQYLPKDAPVLLKVGSNSAKGGGYDLHIGDKIKCTKNCYRECFNEDDEVIPIYNGWFGIITSHGIKMGFEVIGVKFSLWEDEIFIPVRIAEKILILGYAATIHSSQGSDWPVVIGALDFSTPPNMLNSALVYTLITRAKGLCVFVAQNRALYKAIGINATNDKNTFLQELL